MIARPLSIACLAFVALPAAAQPGRLVVTAHAHNAITPSLNASGVAVGTAGRFGLGVRVETIGPTFVRASIGAGSAPDDRLSDTRTDLKAMRVAVGATFGHRLRLEPTLSYGQERLRRITGVSIGGIEEADVRVGLMASMRLFSAAPARMPLDVSLSAAASAGRAVGRMSTLYTGTYGSGREVYTVTGASLGLPVSMAVSPGTQVIVEPLYGFHGRTSNSTCSFCVGGRGAWGVNARLSVALR